METDTRFSVFFEIMCNYDGIVVLINNEIYCYYSSNEFLSFLNKEMHSDSYIKLFNINKDTLVTVSIFLDDYDTTKMEFVHDKIKQFIKHLNKKINNKIIVCASYNGQPDDCFYFDKPRLMRGMIDDYEMRLSIINKKKKHIKKYE